MSNTPWYKHPIAIAVVVGLCICIVMRYTPCYANWLASKFSTQQLVAMGQIGDSFNVISPLLNSLLVLGALLTIAWQKKQHDHDIAWQQKQHDQEKEAQRQSDAMARTLTILPLLEEQQKSIDKTMWGYWSENAMVIALRVQISQKAKATLTGGDEIRQCEILARELKKYIQILNVGVAFAGSDEGSRSLLRLRIPPELKEGIPVILSREIVKGYTDEWVDSYKKLPEWVFA